MSAELLAKLWVGLNCGYIWCIAVRHRLWQQVFLFTRIRQTCVIDELPSAMVGPDAFCDACKIDDVTNMTSKVFCTECKRKYCAEHEKVCILRSTWIASAHVSRDRITKGSLRSQGHVRAWVLRLLNRKQLKIYGNIMSILISTQYDHGGQQS